MPAGAVFRPSCSRGLRRAIALLRKQPAPRPPAANRITLVGLTACGKTHAAFDGRSIPPEPRRLAALIVAFRPKYTRYSSLTRLVGRAPHRPRRSREFHHRLSRQKGALAGRRGGPLTSHSRSLRVAGSVGSVTDDGGMVALLHAAAMPRAVLRQRAQQADMRGRQTRAAVAAAVGDLHAAQALGNDRPGELRQRLQDRLGQSIQPASIGRFRICLLQCTCFHFHISNIIEIAARLQLHPPFSGPDRAAAPHHTPGTPKRRRHGTSRLV